MYRKKKAPLEYVKGSHLWGLTPPRGQFHSPDDYKRELINFAQKNNEQIQIQYVEIPAGRRCISPWIYLAWIRY